jgi:hypothetical protein
MTGELEVSDAQQRSLLSGGCGSGRGSEEFSASRLFADSECWRSLQLARHGVSFQPLTSKWSGIAWHAVSREGDSARCCRCLCKTGPSLMLSCGLGGI